MLRLRHGVLSAYAQWHGVLSAMHRVQTLCGLPAVAQHVQDVPADDVTYQAMEWAGEYPHLYVGGQSQLVNVCQLVL